MTDITMRLAQWLQGAFDARRAQINKTNIPDSAKDVLWDQVQADAVELEMKNLQHPVHPQVLADLRRIAHRYQSVAGFDEGWLMFEPGDEEPGELLVVDDAQGRHWTKPEGDFRWALNTDPSQRRTWQELLAEFGPARPRAWVGDPAVG